MQQRDAIYNGQTSYKDAVCGYGFILRDHVARPVILNKAVKWRNAITSK